MTKGAVSPEAARAACRSDTTRAGVSTLGRGSLQPVPARPYEQTRLVWAISGWTRDQSRANALAPASRMTVGEPRPVQLKCSLRPPMSRRRPGGGPISICCGEELRAGAEPGNEQERSLHLSLLRHHLTDRALRRSSTPRQHCDRGRRAYSCDPSSSRNGAEPRHAMKG